MIRAYYSDTFELPLPAGHRFPMKKYGLLREQLVARGILAESLLRVPAAASDEELLAVHSRSYLSSVVEGRLTRREERAMGFPWSPRLVERSRRSVGASLAAAADAVAGSPAVNLAGGTHHAFPGRGSGYCVFNDVAVAVQNLLEARQIARALIIDCDVHQGDGTAFVFRDDPRVFTLSLHGRRNFPFRKEQSDLDVAFEDGAEDDEYLEALEGALEAGFRHDPDVIAYLAGADPLASDRLGRLALTRRGLRRRDRMVIGGARSRGVPLFAVMAGGYAEPIEETVEVHVGTVAELAGFEAEL